MHGLVSLLWAKIHGLSDDSDTLNWSSNCGLLPKQFVIAESIELCTIAYSFDSITFQGFNYEPIKSYLIETAQKNVQNLSHQLLNNTFNSATFNQANNQLSNCDLLTLWESKQIQSHILAHGCQLMAILAEHDLYEQKIAFNFGKNFAFASSLAESIQNYHTNCEIFSRTDLPLLLYSSKHNINFDDQDFFHCARNINQVKSHSFFSIQKLDSNFEIITFN